MCGWKWWRMGRSIRQRAGQRGGNLPDRHSARGSDDKLWDVPDMEDDPLRDLRPHEDEQADPVGDEYVWPDMNNENEEDD